MRGKKGGKEGHRRKEEGRGEEQRGELEMEKGRERRGGEGRRRRKREERVCESEWTQVPMEAKRGQ